MSNSRRLPTRDREHPLHPTYSLAVAGGSRGGRGLRRGVAAVLVSTVLVTAGQPASAQNAEAAPPASGAGIAQAGTGTEVETGTYLIGPEDVLDIVVRDEPDLSRTLTVRADGYVTLPLIGDLRAVGLAPAELAGEIEAALAAYVREPTVAVDVERATGTYAQRVRVIGSAVTPQALAYEDGLTTLDLLVRIGGLPSYADGNKAYILRRRDGEREQVALRLDDLEDGDATANVALRPGDIVVIPEGFLQGDWRIDKGVQVRETFTDNVDLEPSDEKESALITEIGPFVNLAMNAARLKGNMNARLILRQQSLNDSQTDLLPQVAAGATAEIAEDLFFTDVSASVSQQATGAGEAVSASGASQANKRTVQAYRISPYLVNRFGRWGRLQTRYTNSIVLIEGGDGAADGTASDSIGHTVSAALASGPRFTNLRWKLSASASEIDIEDDDDISRRDAVLQSEYALDRQISLLADVGYQFFDGGDDEEKIDDPLFMGGARWTPSPRASLLVMGGQSNGEAAFRIDGRAQLGARTLATLTYDEDVATTQERLVANLPDAQTELAEFNPRPTPFSFTNRVTRTKTLRGTLSTRVDRNRFLLASSYQQEEFGATNGEDAEEVVDVSLIYGRRLSRVLDLTWNGYYAHTTFDQLNGVASDREDDDYRSLLSLSYTGLRQVTLSLSYALSVRDSNQPRNDFTENAVTVAGTIRF